MSAMDEVEAIIRKYVVNFPITRHGAVSRPVIWDIEPMIKDVVEFRVNEAMERLGLSKRV
jgi:hypothetical protein